MNNEFTCVELSLNKNRHHNHKTESECLKPNKAQAILLTNRRKKKRCKQECMYVDFLVNGSKLYF